MASPTPLTIQKKPFSPVSYTVPELELTVPSYPSLPNAPEIEAPQASGVLANYYTALVKSIITEKLTNFGSFIDRITDYLQKKYIRQQIEVSRTYAQKIRETNSLFGKNGNSLPSGSYHKALQEVLYAELKENENLYLKKLEEANDLISKNISSIFETAIQANELYLDIFENDFKITYEAFTQIFENLVTKYNEYLYAYKLFLQGKELYRETYQEIINIERRKIEELTWQVSQRELTEESKEAINRYLIVYSKYLETIQQLAYANYDQYEIEIEKFKANLQKFKSEIQYIEAISNLITSNVQIYRTKLGVAEAQQRIKDIKLDVVNSTIQSTQAQLRAKEAELQAQIAERRASLAQYEADIANLEAEVKEFIASVQTIIVNYKKQIVPIIQQLTSYELNLANLLETELSIRNEYLSKARDAIWSNEMIVIPSEDIIKVRIALTPHIVDMCKSINRAYVMSCSNLTAEIIRSSV